ncbi:MAG: outer membrane protein transport protein [Verrucomicrobiae bacterium]|nr:outer membrane protein transport protein [Verrucomicrobiae bacterium]
MRKRIPAAVVVMAISLLPARLPGNGMRLGGQDSFAIARGDAFVATADNASAVCYNPAGIAQLEGHNLRGTLAGIYYSPTFTRPDRRGSFEIAEKDAVAGSVFYAYTPPGALLSFGFGIYAPFGGALKWPQNTGFRTVALESSLDFVTVNPVVALKLTENFALGAGVTLNYARIYLEQGLLRHYAPPYINYFRFCGDGVSVGYNLGCLWRVSEEFTLGIAFRSRLPITFDGHAEYEQFGAVPFTRRDAEMDLTFPLGATFGIAYRPAREWNIEFNAEYMDWSSFDETAIRQGPPAAPWPVKQTIPVTLKWDSSWAFKFGLTRYLGRGWRASVGYILNENSVPDDYYTPFAADLDRHFFSAGAGRQGRRLDFDVAYQFGYGPDHTVRGSQPSSTPGWIAGQTADGTYEFVSHSVFVSLGWRF